MKIGIVTEYYHPYSVAEAIRMRAFYDVLERAGHDVHVHASTEAVEGYQVHTHFFGPIVKQTGVAKRLFWELLIGLEMFFRLAFKRYDLVIITSPPFFMSILATWIVRLKGTPYIYDVRDPYPNVYFALGLLSAKGFPGYILRKLEESAYKGAIKITVASAQMAEDIKNRVGDPEKVKVLLNGYSAQYFVPNSEKNKVFTVVFHGNLGRFQDPELILRLASACEEDGHPIRFQVIGDGANDQCFRSKLPGNVTYLGRLPHDELAKIVAKAHVGLSFRTDDPISRMVFPVKIFEYLGAGLPILVTPKSEGGTFVEKHEIGFQFEVNEFEQLYQKLLALYYDQSILARLKTNTLRLRKLHSREENAKILLDAIDKHFYKGLVEATQ